MLSLHAHKRMHIYAPHTYNTQRYEPHRSTTQPKYELKCVGTRRSVYINLCINYTYVGHLNTFNLMPNYIYFINNSIYNKGILVLLYKRYYLLNYSMEQSPS